MSDYPYIHPQKAVPGDTFLFGAAFFVTNNGVKEYLDLRDFVITGTVINKWDKTELADLSVSLMDQTDPEFKGWAAFKVDAALTQNWPAGNASCFYQVQLVRTSDLYKRTPLAGPIDVNRDTVLP